ncbi:hypothetical protein Patl1_26317 [Pistacia atlantica]|uniref:Uncharacterized protein n=1 Tax=Pistacia atlantica TaxID=434234 RepID=A0ACC1B183_9ROSI|nr:hypothetical protein Patl1_26317 [Pistacia atlantica]
MEKKKRKRKSNQKHPTLPSSQLFGADNRILDLRRHGSTHTETLPSDCSDMELKNLESETVLPCGCYWWLVVAVRRWSMELLRV